MIGIVRLLQFYVLLETSLRRIVLMHLRERLAILKQRIRKSRISGDRFHEFVVRARVVFLFLCFSIPSRNRITPYSKWAMAVARSPCASAAIAHFEYGVILFREGMLKT